MRSRNGWCLCLYGGFIPDFIVCQQQALQDIQGQQVPVHADGSLPWWRALDNSQGQVSFEKLEKRNIF